MELRVQHKNILITGGGAGIGRALVDALEASNRVYVVDRNLQALEQLKTDHPSVNVIHADLSDWDSTRNVLGSLPTVVHCLINNAGVGGEGTILDVHAESLDRMVNVNVRAIVCVSQIVARKFIESGSPGFCSIVNVSSLASVFPTRVSVGYNVTKAAVDMLTKSMALELGPYNIRVNSVNPGMVFGTDLSKAWVGAAGNLLKSNLIKRTPLARTLEISDVVNAILFLLCDESVRMVHGEQLVIDGGYTVA